MKTVTISFGPANQCTRSFAEGTTVGQAIDHPAVKASLGHGSNVQPLDSSRRHLSPQSQVQNNQFIILETVANQKANMGDVGGEDIAITVSYGPANSTTQTRPSGTTVADVIADTRFRAALGYGSNVKALIDRIEQSGDTRLENGDRVELETIANQKAA